VTNRRELYCGGRGGTSQRDAMVYPPQPSRYRVVVFAGIFNGVSARVRNYTKSIPWEIVRDYGVLILRCWLVNMDRASVIDRARTRPRCRLNQDQQLGGYCHSVAYDGGADRSAPNCSLFPIWTSCSSGFRFQCRHVFYNIRIDVFNC